MHHLANAPAAVAIRNVQMRGSDVFHRRAELLGQRTNGLDVFDALGWRHLFWPLEFANGIT